MEKHHSNQPSGSGNLLMRCMKKIPLAVGCAFAMLFCMSGVALASESYAQSTVINAAFNNKTISEVLSELEESTEFVFFYNNSQVDVQRRVSIPAGEKDIFKVLDGMFGGTDIAYRVMDRNIVLYDKAKGVASVQGVQQTITVTGNIVDSNGEPIIGASILEDGTTNGIVTDLDGNFTLTGVNANATLVISYVGYKTQNVQVNGRTQLNIVLEEDNEMLEEVVVVGYGVQKKETLTGAVTAIKADEIATTKTENLITNIQGKMPGLLIRQKTGEPGTFDNMLSIRGYGDPLIVIDGVVRDGGAEELAQLASEDIESISILKDASAAIYGMNAANGVIIVTTKKGVAEKTRVSYSAMFGMKNPTGMESTVDAYTFRVLANERALNGQEPLIYDAETLEKYRTNAPGYQDHDWLDLFLKNMAFQQNHNISVRGGSEKVKYYVSFGYTDDNGLLKSDIQYYKRYNLRSNLTAELAKGLTLNVNMSGRYTQTQRAREDFQWTFKTLMVNDRGIGGYTMENPNHLSDIGPESKNPYALVDKDIDGYRQDKRVNYTADVELKWELPWVEGLSVSALGSFDGYNRNQSSLERKYQLYDYFTDTPTKTGGSSADKYTSTMNLYQKIYGRIQAQYQNSFGNHNLNVTAIAELSSTRSDYLTGSRQYTELFTNDMLNQGSASTQTNDGNREFGRLAAYLARANYDYAGKYLLEVLARYDGSYRYAPGHRWAFFPSFSAGWRLSEENFIKDNLPFITNLKLRGSYGKSGYDAGDPFQYVSAYTMASLNNNPLGYTFDGSSQVTGYVAPGVVTDQLSWVTSTIANIGIDFDLWNGKLNGSFEWFNRKNTGILADRQQAIPNTFGASFPKENLNSTRNRGFEFNIGTRGQIGKDFQYSVSANFTYARERRLHQEEAEFQSSMDRWQNGKSDRNQNIMWLYKYDGQYTSLEQYENAPLLGGDLGNSKMLPGSFRLLDLNGNGMIDWNDRVPEFWATGANPPIQYGLTIAANYKNFDINILFQGASGYSIGYANDDVWGYGAKTNKTYLLEKYLDRWHVANTGDDPYDPATKWISGKYPALRSSFNNTTDNGNQWNNGISFWNPLATYVRLKSLEIGYSLPKPFMQRLGINSCRFFVNGSNLFTICNDMLKNADPEREERDWGANLAYPLMRTFNIGLNINF